MWQYFVEFNQKPIDNFVIFRRKLLALTPGQTINLKIFREGKNFEVTSKLIKKPTETKQNEKMFGEDDPSSLKKLTDINSYDFFY